MDKKKGRTSNEEIALFKCVGTNLLEFAQDERQI